jgi:cytochrome oxidase assembly protein ShyY1
VYRFLATPRWLGYAALTLVAAFVMVLLGFWQLDRYHQRTAINDRIDAGAAATPMPLAKVLAGPPQPRSKGSLGPSPAEDMRWTRVTITGRFDRANEVLVRGRTVEGAVGFEVITPLVLADGSAVLVDRGWVAPANGGALIAPPVPAAPEGTVTVNGSLRPPESRGAQPQTVSGHLETRRISPGAIGKVVPYALFDAYIAVDQAQPGLTAVTAEKENALQNGGYVIQWWLFAAGTIIGFVYVARREARGPRERLSFDDDDDDDDPDPAEHPGRDQHPAI